MSAGRLPRSAVLLGLTSAILLVALAAVAQRPFFFRPLEVLPNPPYDGRFTFARLKYSHGPEGYYYRGIPAWSHGYPTAERNLMKIVNEISDLHPRLTESVVVAMDDPELCKLPVAYMTEAGFWDLTDKEAAGFRDYLLKGGFVIFDDFRPVGSRIPSGGGWDNFEANMHRVLPDARIVDLDVSNPIFDAFFKIPSFNIVPQDYDSGRPIFRGIFQDNDPKKRLMAMINFNTDVSNFWEFSATGYRPIEESNEAYKLGVNYIMYGLMH